MKLHLPLTLLTAVLATFIALPAHAVEAPEGYTTTYLYSPGTLETNSELTAEEYIAFIPRRSQKITPTDADYWTSSTPLVSGGHVFFGSYNSDSPVALSFKDGYGSAFYGQSALTFDTLSNLTFSTITGRSAAISLANNGSLTITNVNDGQSDTVDVLFEDIKNTYSSGGAIFASTVTISHNGNVSFSGNSSSSYDYSRGGAIFASTVTISHNGNVSFSGNSSSSSSYDYSRGGAIYAYHGLTISHNGDVSFSGNSSDSSGGAICVLNGLTISHNGDVSFSGNSDSNGGGAIYARDGLTISHNGDVSFSGNFSYSYGGAIYARNGLTISHNGDVSFSGNSATTSSSDGGAIYADNGGVTIRNNGDVSFSGNSSSSTYSYGSSYSYSRGGAICAYNGPVTISNNGNVSFSGNSSSSSDNYASNYSYGGAIYALGLTIQGNDSVLFEKNYENSRGVYRLRSIYSGGGMTLSAKTGGNITFYDSVYIRLASYFNSDYTDAEGNTQSAGGDIIFSGKYAEQHLNEILAANNENRTATAKEIQNSQTSEFRDTIYLQNGSLQIVDGARLNGSGLQVSGEAKLLMRDSYMSHTGYSLTFATGTELELQGSNTLTATSLTLNAGATLTATLTDANLQQAALNLNGSLYTYGALNLNLNVETEHAEGMYQIISLTDSSKYDVSGWTAGNITFNGSGAAAGASFGDLLWRDGVLYYVTSPLWSNASGSGVWSCEDANWNRGSVFRNGQDVLFSDRGAGTVQLSGDIAPGSICVNSSSDYIFTAAEDGGRLVGSTGISKSGSGELTLATANAHTGDTELLEGTINIQHSTALGATAEGQAALIAAEGTTITVENGSQVVLAAEGNDIAGAVEIDEGAALVMKGGNYSVSNSTVNGSLILSDQTDAKLSGTTTVNGSLSISGLASSSITGTVDIAEGASVEMIGGYYTASRNTVDGTLSLNEVNATAGTLTGSGSLRVKDGSVSFSDTGTYKGSLSVEGSNAELTLTKGGYKGSGTVAVQGGKLTLENRGSITINEGGQLAVSDEATVKATSSINILEGATLSIGDVCAAVELNSLMSNEMAVYTTAAAEGYDPTVAVHTAVGGVLETNSLNMFAGSTLIANGAHIDMNGAELTIDSYEEQKINLVLTLGANYTPDSQVVLFSNVGSVYLFMDDLFGVSGDEIVYTVNAGDYFTGEWINESTTLNYDSTANVVYLQGVSNVVPEPTTATLSLLALAALAMRRRRR